MASITQQRIGKYVYLYESVSFRDENKRPRNKKIPIGKIDPETQKVIYKQEYIDKMAAKGTPVHQENNDENDDIKKIVYTTMDSIKDYGNFYLLKSIAEKTGLIKCLSEAMPDYWQKIFTLACYLVCADKPVMYCEEWVLSTETLPTGSMSSQSISKLLLEFSNLHRNCFYETWGRHISEQEYIALDITSISSYSKQIHDCEWGYNRDNEKLPQVNLCMLLGEHSRLPIYQSIYSGSLKDVSTLLNTLKEMSALVPDKNLQIVMDRGFYSAKNINTILEDYKGYRFLMAVPFTNNFAKNQIKSEKDSIDHISNTILTSAEPIRGVCRLREWGKNMYKLYTHIFFNPVKALKDRNEMYGYITELMKLAIQDKDNEKQKTEFEKYLSIQDSETNSLGYTVSIREDVIEKEFFTSGWTVFVSNNIDDAQKAHEIYKAKDVVEKGFDRLKNCLGLHRLRVHSDERMQNKLFIGFIALIVVSHIHKVMDDSQLYKMMTMDELLITMAKLKTATVGGVKYIRPLTKMQKYILDIFGVKEPVG